jgi:hypothetical protein
MRFIQHFKKELSESDPIELRTPDGWALLRSYFEERGYDVAHTAEAAAAMGLVELIGGTVNLSVLASSKVRELLRVLSRRRGENRHYLAKRTTLKFEHFRGRLGREAAEDVLRWLLERRVVFRGVILECPRCRMCGWYTIDRVDEVWRCDGCQKVSPIPLDPDKTEWHYRINELYAHGHDQGVLTPLLTLHAMDIAWGSLFPYGVVGFYPGVKIKAREGADVPFCEKEIDLVAVRGNELILAECKESTEYLSAPEKASQFAWQLGDLVKLADHLQAPQLVVASSTSFPENRETLLSKTPTNYSVDISWLDGRDLLDPDDFAHPLSNPSSTSERADKPKGWETGYLGWVRRNVINRFA